MTRKSPANMPQLVQQEAGYALQDLGSTNGTFVNYRRIISLTPLQHGDVVTFGEEIVLIYWDESVADGRPLPPVQAEIPAPVTAAPPSISAPAAPSPTPGPPPTVSEPIAEPEANKTRRWLLGCAAAALLFVCVCLAALFFLDSYQQGRLLYCGALRPFWQVVLGPFGFNPACT